MNKKEIAVLCNEVQNRLKERAPFISWNIGHSNPNGLYCLSVQRGRSDIELIYSQSIVNYELENIVNGFMKRTFNIAYFRHHQLFPRAMDNSRSVINFYRVGRFRRGLVKWQFRSIIGYISFLKYIVIMFVNRLW